MYGAVKILLTSAGGLLFAAGLAGYLYVRLTLKPRWQEIEETYYEMEDAHPAMKRYQRALRITMGILAGGMLLLFLALVL